MNNRAILLLALSTALPSAVAAPCYGPLNNLTQLETPCYKVIHTAATPREGLALELREYAGGEAMVAESKAPNATIRDYTEALIMTSFNVINYFQGPGNTPNQPLLTSRTVPLTFHPPTSSRDFWVGRMALAPSLWPPHSKPPTPVKGESLELTPLGKGSFLLASIKKQFEGFPLPPDVETMCATLESNLGLLGATLDPDSIYSPAHAYYFEKENGGLDDVECWLGVTAA